MKSLLSEAVHLRSGTEVHSRLLRVLPFLTYGDRDKMSLVIGHFDDVTDFDAFDAGHGAEDEAKVQAFVAMCDGIERNQIGNTLKAQMLELGVVDKCISYIEVRVCSLNNVPLVRFVSHPYTEKCASHFCCGHQDGGSSVEGVRDEALSTLHSPDASWIGYRA